MRKLILDLRNFKKYWESLLANKVHGSKSDILMLGKQVLSITIKGVTKLGMPLETVELVIRVIILTRHVNLNEIFLYLMVKTFISAFTNAINILRLKKLRKVRNLN